MGGCEGVEDGAADVACSSCAGRGLVVGMLGEGVGVVVYRKILGAMMGLLIDDMGLSWD